MPKIRISRLMIALLIIAGLSLLLTGCVEWWENLCCGGPVLMPALGIIILLGKRNK
jgi:hypothetical protein